MNFEDWSFARDALVSLGGPWKYPESGIEVIDSCVAAKPAD
jgi:hypothetical protein